MGTSKSFPTPSGGAWTPLKNDITDMLGGDNRVTPDRIVGGVIRASGGLDLPASSSYISADRGSGGIGGAGGGSGSRAGGGGSGPRTRASVAGTASSLGAFGQALARSGLDEALGSLGLEHLRGRPAAEVISRIADHLAEGADPLQRELLADALREALLEAALTEDPAQHSDLEESLQSFLDQNGIEGLIQAFLSNYVFDHVWMSIEEHAYRKGDSATASEALGIAVGQVCRAHVEALIREMRASGRFEQVDWFGPEGIRLGAQLVSDLESRLRTL